MKAPDVDAPGAGVGAGAGRRGQETQPNSDADHLSMQVGGVEFPAYTGTREAWAYAILDALAPRLADMGIKMPEGRTVRVGVLPLSRGRLGFCCGSGKSESGNVNFIGLCTKQAEPVELVHTLVHEFLHACDDCMSGHRHRWARWAKLLGMQAKGHDRGAVLSALIHDALHAVGTPAAHVASVTPAAAAALPSQCRMECPSCKAHAYIPMKAAMDDYFIYCGDCIERMQLVERSTKAQPAARVSA